MMILDRPDIKAIWSNCKDSIRHAGKHLDEWQPTKKQDINENTHHGKWATISVAHAADCYLKIIAKTLNPNSELFSPKSKKALFHNPSLTETIKFLKKNHKKEFQNSWESFFKILEFVHAKRNEIIHRVIPEDLPISVSLSAWGLLGLLQSIRKKYCINSDIIIDRSPPIETHLIELIGHRRLESYTKYIETYLTESYCNNKIHICPICNAQSVLNGQCEVCFQNIQEIECEHCGEINSIPEDNNLVQYLELNRCAFCGKIIS